MRNMPVEPHFDPVQHAMSSPRSTFSSRLSQPEPHPGGSDFEDDDQFSTADSDLLAIQQRMIDLEESNRPASPSVSISSSELYTNTDDLQDRPNSSTTPQTIPGIHSRSVENMRGPTLPIAHESSHLALPNDSESFSARNSNLKRRRESAASIPSDPPRENKSQRPADSPASGNQSNILQMLGLMEDDDFAEVQREQLKAERWLEERKEQERLDEEFARSLQETWYEPEPPQQSSPDVSPAVPMRSACEPGLMPPPSRPMAGTYMQPQTFGTQPRISEETRQPVQNAPATYSSQDFVDLTFSSGSEESYPSRFHTPSPHTPAQPTTPYPGAMQANPSHGTTRHHAFGTYGMQQSNHYSSNKANNVDYSYLNPALNAQSQSYGGYPSSSNHYDYNDPILEAYLRTLVQGYPPGATLGSTAQLSSKLGAGLSQS